MLYPTELWAVGKYEAPEKWAADEKKAVDDSLLKWSEYKDSNLGPPGPKPGALPGCATLRKMGLYRMA